MQRADLATIHTPPPVHDGARLPSVSPDGTLVAYVSGEMGRDEIFLTSLPNGEGKWQLSATGGGGWTLFHPRGTAVFYRALDGSFMSVPVAGGSRGVAGMPVEQMNRRSSLSIVQNWPREFAAR